MTSPKKVAVIGAGASGLPAIYSCKEENLDVVCFEKSSHLGGLWQYREEDVDDLASVMKSTVMNTSKEMSAYSTFPPPKELPNYMHHSVVLKYFELYAEKFGLEKHIKYRHEVIRAERHKNFDENGQWVLKIRDIENDRVYEEVFDGVMVCTGHHVQPNMPKYPGQDQFQGKIIHSHSYKVPKEFEGKRVVVVGAGNSGCDAAVELSGIAEKVYLSTRRGTWVFSRLTAAGKPADAGSLKRCMNTLFSILPFNVSCSYLENQVNMIMDHELYRIKPRHRILNQHPTINDLLPNRIISGLVIVKGDIQRFTPNGVIFVDDDEEHPVDAVIMATGYQLVFPFLEEEVTRIKDNRMDLYKFVFPPNLSKPTLAFIGLIQPNGPIFPAAELHSRWFAAVFNGKVKLPSQQKMKEDVMKTTENMKKQYTESHRHTMETNWMPYMEEVASMLGVKPNLWLLAITDPKLWYAIYFGPMLPYHYRIRGPHPWKKAREAILTFSERVNGALDTRRIPREETKGRCARVKSSKKTKCLAAVGLLIIAGVPAVYYCVVNAEKLSALTEDWGIKQYF